MRFIATSIAILLLTACASEEQVFDAESSELKFYEAAQKSLLSGNYNDAVGRLQLLEARFPFGRFAEQSQLEIIYAYYKSGQAEAARAASDRFLRLHPQHPNADYAYYLKGLTSFEEDQNFLERILPINPATRDLGAAKDSFEDFNQLVLRYPNSKYAPDAQQRMIYLRNLMAEHEIDIARYYIRRGAYIAAANRGRHVFESYQQAPVVPEALAIMIEAYQLLDMEDLALESLTVLNSNYPDHELLDKDGRLKASKSVKNKKSWINILTFGLAG